MTISEACKNRIGKLCLPTWHKYMHIELYLCFKIGYSKWGEPPEGIGELYHGPWVRLYDPPSSLVLNRKWNYYDTLTIFSFGGSNYKSWIAPEDYDTKFLIAKT